VDALVDPTGSSMLLPASLDVRARLQRRLLAGRKITSMAACGQGRMRTLANHELVSGGVRSQGRKAHGAQHAQRVYVTSGRR
jgi:hypothetical protein